MILYSVSSKSKHVLLFDWRGFKLTIVKVTTRAIFSLNVVIKINCVIDVSHLFSVNLGLN